MICDLSRRTLERKKEKYKRREREEKEREKKERASRKIITINQVINYTKNGCQWTEGKKPGKWETDKNDKKYQ